MSGETSTSRPDRREAILTNLYEATTNLFDDIQSRTPDTPEEEALQLRRYHELGYLANQYRKLQRDTDIDEMQEELALLHEAASRERT